MLRISTSNNFSALSLKLRFQSPTLPILKPYSGSFKPSNAWLRTSQFCTLRRNQLSKQRNLLTSSRRSTKSWRRDLAFSNAMAGTIIIISVLMIRKFTLEQFSSYASLRILPYKKAKKVFLISWSSQLRSIKTTSLSMRFYKGIFNLISQLKSSILMEWLMTVSI